MVTWSSVFDGFSNTVSSASSADGEVLLENQRRLPEAKEGQDVGDWGVGAGGELNQCSSFWGSRRLLLSKTQPSPARPASSVYPIRLG